MNHIHREEFEHCQDVLETAAERRSQLQKQQSKLLEEIGQAQDQLTVNKKQAELASIQSELTTLQSIENASVNQVLARSAENENYKDAQEKSDSEALENLNESQKRSFAEKFQNMPFRKKYKNETFSSNSVAFKVAPLTVEPNK